MSRTVAARYGGTCPTCRRRWAKGDPITAYGDSSEHVDRWGHPACVAADDLGYPSADDARQRIDVARQALAGARKPPPGQPFVSTRGAVQ